MQNQSNSKITLDTQLETFLIRIRQTVAKTVTLTSLSPSFFLSWPGKIFLLRFV